MRKSQHIVQRCADKPTAARSASSILVSTVTAISKGDCPAPRNTLFRRQQHAFAAQRMYVQHPHTQFGRSMTGAGHRVGNIMKFQIEKDIKTTRHKVFHQPWSGTGKQFLADLQTA